MSLFNKTFTVVRTIWPYEDGWGVKMEQFGKQLTVCSQGLSKEEAEEDAIELRLKDKYPRRK